MVVGIDLMQSIRRDLAPDPFQTFVANKYSNAKGYRFDFFTGEWDYKCSTCKEDLSAPSRKIMTKIRLFHTRNECLGGY